MLARALAHGTHRDMMRAMQKLSSLMSAASYMSEAVTPDMVELVLIREGVIHIKAKSDVAARAMASELGLPAPRWINMSETEEALYTSVYVRETRLAGRFFDLRNVQIVLVGPWSAIPFSIDWRRYGATGAGHQAQLLVDDIYDLCRAVFGAALTAPPETWGMWHSMDEAPNRRVSK